MGRTDTLVADDIVVGEGVAIDIPPAGFVLRVLGGLVDLVVSAVVMGVAVYVVSKTGIVTDEALQRAFIISIVACGFLVVPVTVESLSHGKSLGKLICGTRVVRDDYGPSGFRQALTRAVLALVEIWATSGALAGLTVLMTRRARRFGDLAAGTVVVKERIPLRVSPPVRMPRGLEDWAGAADVAALPTPLALGIRQFLARSGSLHPRARAQLADDLVLRASEYVYPMPPFSDVPAEVLLMAIVAERMRRDSQTIARNRRLADKLFARG